jgi:hypothetical protein
MKQIINVMIAFFFMFAMQACSTYKNVRSDLQPYLERNDYKGARTYLQRVGDLDEARNARQLKYALSDMISDHEANYKEGIRKNKRDNRLPVLTARQKELVRLYKTGKLSAEQINSNRREFIVVTHERTKILEEIRIEKYKAEEKRRRNEEAARLWAIAEAKEKIKLQQEHQMWLGIAQGMSKILVDGIEEVGRLENQIVAERNRIYADQQSYNENVRANKEKQKRDSQQFKQEREERIRTGEAFAAQQSSEWASFQKELEQKYSHSNKTNTTASTVDSQNSNNSYDETSNSGDSTDSSIKKDTRTKYVAKRIEVSTSGGAWATKEKAFEWLNDTVFSNQLRRACDLTRVVPLNIQDVTYRKTDSGRFHAKGTALGYCELPSDSSYYKSTGWCSAKGFNISERHGCALSSPM